MDALVSLAKDIAYNAHRGQFRRDGTPYFMHIYRVSEDFSDKKLKIIALLHDVLEDTDETAEGLINRGIPQDLVIIVELLSKNKYETYETYLKSIKENNQATQVKISDMLDNLCDNPTKNQILKYSEALVYLLT